MESMLEVAKPVTEQSVMKILAHVFDTTAEAKSQTVVIDETLSKLLTTLDEKEQAHADTIMGLEQRNVEAATCILGAVNRLAERQEAMKARAAERHDSMAGRLATLESVAGQVF